MTVKRAKHFVSMRSLSSHFKLTDVARLLSSNGCFGSVRPLKSSDMELSRYMTTTCSLGMDHNVAGRVHSKIKFVWQPGGKGFEMSTRECCYHWFVAEVLSQSAELRGKGTSL
jgi:hypothetical protein